MQPPQAPETLTRPATRPARAARPCHRQPAMGKGFDEPHPSHDAGLAQADRRGPFDVPANIKGPGDSGVSFLECWAELRQRSCTTPGCYSQLTAHQPAAKSCLPRRLYLAALRWLCRAQRGRQRSVTETAESFSCARQPGWLELWHKAFCCSLDAPWLQRQGILTWLPPEYVTFVQLKLQQPISVSGAKPAAPILVAVSWHSKSHTGKLKQSSQNRRLFTSQTKFKRPIFITAHTTTLL